MQIEFIRDGDTVTHSSWQPVSARQIGKDGRGVELGGGFKLSGIQSGTYTFRVTVRDPESKTDAQGETLFSVESK